MASIAGSVQGTKNYIKELECDLEANYCQKRAMAQHLPSFLPHSRGKPIESVWVELPTGAAPSRQDKTHQAKE